MSIFTLDESRGARYNRLAYVITERLAAQVRSLMDRYNCSQGELAVRLTTTTINVKKLLDPRGLQHVTFATLLKLADALDVALDIRLCTFTEATAEGRLILEQWEDEALEEFATDPSQRLHRDDEAEYDAREERFRKREEAEERLRRRDPVDRKKVALDELFAKQKRAKK